MNELEEKINSYTISFTDQFFYFPLVNSLPDSIVLDYYLWDFPKGGTKEKNTSLIITCKNRTYLEIALSICEGLMGFEYKEKDFWNLNNRTRKMLYDKISVDDNFINRYKSWETGKGYM